MERKAQQNMPWPFKIFLVVQSTHSIQVWMLIVFYIN